MAEAAVVTWLSRNGAQVHPLVHVAQSPLGDPAIICTDDIPSSTTILTFPSPAVLSVTSGSLIQKVPSLSEKSQWTAFILTVMFEASQKDSKWKIYFSSLPREFDTLMYWSEDELKELEGSAVLNKIGKEEAEMMYAEEVKPFVESHRDVFEGVDTSLDAFHRAGSWIMAFSSDFENPDKPHRDEDDMDEDDEDDEYDSLVTYKALVPFGNLIQADCDLANCEFSSSETSVSLLTTKDIPKGSFLFTDPGPVPRSDLLRRVGSCPESSAQHDVIEIDSSLLISVAGKNLSEATRETRIEKLVEEELLEDSYDIETDGAIPSEILIVIQAFQVDDQTFASYAEEEKFHKAKKDAKTRDIMLEVIQNRREMFKTTIEEDTSILQTSAQGLPRRNRMAIEVRLGEKKILNKMEEVVRAWEDMTMEGQAGRSSKRQKR